MAIEIVDLPNVQMVIFRSFLYVYQAGYLGAHRVFEKGYLRWKTRKKRG